MMYEVIFKTRINITDPDMDIDDYLTETKPIQALRKAGYYFDGLEVKVVSH